PLFSPFFPFSPHPFFTSFFPSFFPFPLFPLFSPLFSPFPFFPLFSPKFSAGDIVFLKGISKFSSKNRENWASGPPTPLNSFPLPPLIPFLFFFLLFFLQNCKKLSLF